MIYELDISNVKTKPVMSLTERARLFKIPCKTGEHQLAFDVIECDVPKDIYQELVAKLNYYGSTEVFPVGFDKLPIGSILTRIR